MAIVKRNYPIVINFAQLDKTELHYILEELDFKEVGEKTLVTVAPLDVRLESTSFWNPFPKGREERKKRYELLLEKGCRQAITNTKHREIIMYLPDDPENLPDTLKNTFLGQAISIYKSIENWKIKVSEVLQKAGYNEQQIMDMIAGSQINEQYMQFLDKRFSNIASLTKTTTQYQQQKQEESK